MGNVTVEETTHEIFSDVLSVYLQCIIYSRELITNPGCGFFSYVNQSRVIAVDYFGYIIKLYIIHHYLRHHSVIE